MSSGDTRGSDTRARHKTELHGKFKVRVLYIAIDFSWKFSKNWSKSMLFVALVHMPDKFVGIYCDS